MALDPARLRTNPAYYTQARNPQLHDRLTADERVEVQTVLAWRFNVAWDARQAAGRNRLGQFAPAHDARGF